jgi:hypothetical protein
MRGATRAVAAAFAAAALLPACSTTTRNVTGLAPAAGGRPRGEVALAVLSLSIAFQPKVLGYSFSAGQLILRDRRGGEWRPRAASAGWMRYGSCESSGSLGDALGGYVPLARGACVLVAFDHAVDSGERLELVVAGAAVGRRRLEPVTVALARTERKTRSADPVLVEMLTLPLKILLFPLAMYGGG